MPGPPEEIPEPDREIISIEQAYAALVEWVAADVLRQIKRQNDLPRLRQLVQRHLPAKQLTEDDPAC